MPNLGPMEIAIIAVVLLVLFGGAKLAGLGKSTGRALREFKEETKGLRDSDGEDGQSDKSDDKSDKDAGKQSGTDSPSKDDVTRELTQGPDETGAAHTERADEAHRDT